VQQLHAGADCDQVRSDIQRVGHDQGDDQPTDTDTSPPAEMAAGQLTQSLTGGQRHPITDLLDRHHQRQRDQRRPQQPETVLRAGLRVGRDPGRIIVGGTGHQPWTQRPPRAPRPARLGTRGRTRHRRRHLRTARRCHGLSIASAAAPGLLIAATWFRRAARTTSCRDHDHRSPLTGPTAVRVPIALRE
jgi:hypothetical protein